MNNEINVICNLLNPLIKKENVLEGYWMDILNNLYSLNNEEVNVRARLNITGFKLTSREQLQIKDINEDNDRGLEAFAIFLYFKVNIHDHELPIIKNLIGLILHDFTKYKATIRGFVNDKDNNIYLHNYAVCNDRIVRFLNKLYSLFCLNLYKVSQTKSNSEIFKEYQEFIAEYEFNKELYKPS